MLDAPTDIKVRLLPSDSRNRPSVPHDEDPLWVQAIDQAGDFIAISDLEGRLVRANRAFLAALGRSAEDAVGRHFTMALTPDYPPSLTRALEHQPFQDAGWKGECRFALADGGSMLAQLTVSPLKDADGQLIGSIAIACDITERKRIELVHLESEEQFRHLAENMRDVCFMGNPDPPSITYISPRYEETWGRSCQELYDRWASLIEAVHPEDHARATDSFEQCFRGLPTDVEFRVVGPDGAIRWIHARTFPVKDANGRLIRFVGIAEDVSKRKLAELAIQDVHEQLDRAMQQTARLSVESTRLNDVIDILQSCQSLDEAYRIIGDTLPSILAASAGALCITNPSRNIVEAVSTWGDGKATETAFPPDQCWALRRGKLHVVNGGTSPVRCAHVVGTSLGGHVCVPLAAQGETLGVLCLEGLRDSASAEVNRQDDRPIAALARNALAIGERLSLALANLRLQEALRRQSIRDPLTGMFNRRYMEESLQRELKRAARDGQPVSLLMMDIDHFKHFNDTFGHPAGDMMLRALGEFLLKGTRDEDIACRYGGEEFVVIMAGATITNAVARAEALREAAKHVVVPYAGQVLGTITLSMGVAAFPTHGDTPESLLHTADRALYRAKGEGRDRVVVA
jgi:diguanylate cyclase (GGDEF)-like protein/PAS domain S-box-containing protein